MSHLDKKPSPGLNVQSCQVSPTKSEYYNLGVRTYKQTNRQTDRQTNEVLYSIDSNSTVSPIHDFKLLPDG